MKHIPILFSTPMVQAIMEGRKTMTRRIMKPQPEEYQVKGVDEVYTSRYGKKGDILWVRETWQPIEHPELKFRYKADHLNPDSVVWKPSIFMPFSVCRVFLEVDNVRIERLHDISVDDVLAEGVDNGKSNKAMGVRWENMQVMAFEELWAKINGQESWNANPFVWVIEFKKIDKPENVK